jgi:hypothetical protein
MKPADQNPISFKWRLILLAMAGLFLYMMFALVSLLYWGNLEQGIIIGHFPAVIGLPMAAAFAFILVVLLPINYGRTEFQALGIKFKGASGPVVLWMICFVVIVVAVKLLW